MERLLTTDELCEMWQVKKSWVYDEVQSGRLKARKLGRQLRFLPADCEAYLEQKAAA